MRPVWGGWCRCMPGIKCSRVAVKPTPGPTAPRNVGCGLAAHRPSGQVRLSRGFESGALPYGAIQGSAKLSTSRRVPEKTDALLAQVGTIGDPDQDLGPRTGRLPRRSPSPSPGDV